MPELTLITPTGDRPDAFWLCERWMMRQTYPQPYQWICVDDGEIPTNFTLGQHVIRRQPSPGKVTLCENLLAAIPYVRGEKILIVEDDEWYAPGYLESMSKMLDDADLVGEKEARYYNVASRRWFCPNNQKHASLCRTGLRRWLLLVLKVCCHRAMKKDDVFVDLRLWDPDTHLEPQPRRKLASWGGLSVGIKGMPGRAGAGKNHAWHAFPHRDPTMDKLREWIGRDADAYAGFANMKYVMEG